MYLIFGISTLSPAACFSLKQATCLQHYKEAACHQLAMEKLLHEAGVDLVFTGTPQFLTRTLKPPRMHSTPEFVLQPSLTNNKIRMSSVYI